MDEAIDRRCVLRRLSRRPAGCIRAALAQLPGEQRQAVELAYFNGNTFVEIAAMVEVPIGTVKSRVRLALAKLKRLLDADLVS